MVCSPMRRVSTSRSACRIEVFCVALVLAACRPAAVGTHMPQADLILRNGDIWTNAGAPVRSVAVVDGRIAAIGDDAEKLAGPKTRVVELGGRTVLPALTDAHAHLFGL